MLCVIYICVLCDACVICDVCTHYAVCYVRMYVVYVMCVLCAMYVLLYVCLLCIQSGPTYSAHCLLCQRSS